MQAIVTSFQASHSIEALQNSLNIPTECPICCTRFTNPATTPCGHTFCRNCLVRSLDHQRSCPFCRDPLDFCPPPTKLLVDLLGQLYQHDDETMDEHTLNEFDASETRVPLLIGSLAFPHMNCVIHVFEPRYRLMLRRIMASTRRRFAMCLARRKRTAQNQTPFFEYGTILELMNVQTLPDGRFIVQAVGSHRFKVLNFELIDGYHMADIERIDDIDREQENLLEQQQILKVSAMRARQQQTQPTATTATTATPVPARPMVAARPMAAVRPMSAVRPMAAVTRPMAAVSRPMAAVSRPTAAAPRPMAAAVRPMAARPMAARSASATPARPAQAQPMMPQQRQSWAQRAHPQTQTQTNRASWLQGLTAARPKAHSQLQQASPNTTLLPLDKSIEKNRQEQSTNELLDELATFIDKLLLHRQQNQAGMANWLGALGDPPVLRGASRDQVILSWWIVNMMPLGEDEKLPLLSMRTVRERVLVIISWVDKFHDQWSLFLNGTTTNTNTSTTTTPNTCCIS